MEREREERATLVVEKERLCSVEMKGVVEVADGEVASVVAQTEREHIILDLGCLEEGGRKRVDLRGHWLAQSHDAVCLLREEQLRLSKMSALPHTLWHPNLKGMAWEATHSSPKQTSSRTKIPWYLLPSM